MIRSVLIAGFLAGVCGVSGADNNPAGSPPLGGAMSHVLVTVVGQNPATRLGGTFFIGFESPSLNPVSMTAPAGPFAGGASVLDGSWFNGQYGWLVSGFWGLPAGGRLWVREIDQSGGLEAYAGRPFLGYDQFDPLFGTGGASDLMQWDGTMLHNYYAVRGPGLYSVTYEVYIGDASGAVWPGSAAPAMVTLSFESDGPVVGCAEDLDGSGVVDLGDVLISLSSFGAGAGGDVTGDGVTTLDDVLAILSRFGEGC